MPALKIPLNALLEGFLFLAVYVSVQVLCRDEQPQAAKHLPSGHYISTLCGSS